MFALSQVTVGDTATLIYTASVAKTTVSLRANTSFVYLGGSNAVTVGNGFRLANRVKTDLSLTNGDQIWGIAARSSIVTILAQRDV